MATERLTLGNVRLAFAKGLWEASKYKGQGEAKFKVKLIVPHDHKQKAQIDAIIQRIAKEEWGTNAGAVLKALGNNAMKFCWLDGDTQPEWDGFPGNMYLSVSSKVRPTCKAADGVTPVTESDGVIYGGCYVNALLEFRTQDHQDYGKGLFCTIRGVQFFRPGDAFTGGGKPADDSEFSDLSVDSNDDPTA